METTTKRGRRFERRLAERKRWAAMKDAQKRESILEALHEVLQIADEDESVTPRLKPGACSSEC